jgi:hypothetical protein
MLRTILDTIGFMVVLSVGVIGFVPGAIPDFSQIWAERPQDVIVLGAQVFTWVWGLLAVAIFISRTAGSVIERRVMERIKAKQAQDQASS